MITSAAVQAGFKETMTMQGGGTYKKMRATRSLTIIIKRIELPGVAFVPCDFSVFNVLLSGRLAADAIGTASSDLYGQTHAVHQPMS